MNLNDNPEELKREEQEILDTLISRMDSVLQNLDRKMRGYVVEAKNADISVNPDLYLSQLLAQQGLKDTQENRKRILKARDELYHTRLLLQYKDSKGSGIEEIKVGLHSCMNGGESFVHSWTMPLCRHYILDNASTEYESIVKEKNGDEYYAQYKLLVKNQVTLRFTRVVKALNMFPGVFDDKTLKMMKGKRFISDKYLDEMIKRFNPNDYDPDAAARIISDEFLQELLERRSTPEFKNIVFSIQKKQGEIIQAPYNRDMIVQGCAGSGKSMIMLHRLPILLYDNPNRLSRNGLYIITPSPMYIQLAENMRNQLEIADIKMGTIEQYYDYCISKYIGHKAGEYGKISYGLKINHEDEKYIYSQKCEEDIINYFESIGRNAVSLDKAYTMLSVKETDKRPEITYSQKLSRRLLRLQNVMNANNEVLIKYFGRIKALLDALYSLSATLRHRKSEVIREIKEQISGCVDVKTKALNEIEGLNPEEKALSIKNRISTIAAEDKKIEQLSAELLAVNEDNDYFNSLLEINDKVESVLVPFESVKNEFSRNSTSGIYDAISRIGQLIGGFYMISWELSKVDDKYSNYIGTLRTDIDAAANCVKILQAYNDKYIDYNYYSKIKEEHEELSKINSNAVKNAYRIIMENIGIRPTEKGTMRAVKCSPYVYLQALFCFQGAPMQRESLLAIDEAQGLAPEEIRLLKKINSDEVVFNMYGDIFQHIEGTKGIDKWDEFKDIIDFDYYEMLENYRNASQITEYCNHVFGMSMNPINTPGKGVHVIGVDDDFREEMIAQLMDTQRAGLSAILVNDDAEARSFIDKFSSYEQKLHDMTDEEFSLHRTRWNIMNINDAKGLEFGTVIVLSGRMSRNQRYIAFTRALDDLYIYPGLIDITGFEKKPRRKTIEEELDNNGQVEESLKNEDDSHKAVEKKPTGSAVKEFFESNGLQVIDNRNQGGRLWVIGEKTAIRETVNTAISKFGISGKYTISKETNFKNGWCTKTDK